MVGRTRRINNHEEIEAKLMQLKFEEIHLRERLKKNEKEFNKWSKRLLRCNM